jgi:hypothetical protein
VPSTSWTKTLETPSLDVDEMLYTPDMPETAFSIGSVMSCSTSCAVAPVYDMLTLTNGMLIGGSRSILRNV